MKKLEEFALINKSLKKKKTVAVVKPEDNHTLEAVMLAYKEKTVNPILIGNRPVIKSLLEQMDCEYEESMIVEGAGDDEAASIAIDMIRSGDADLIMKGLIQTKDLMRKIVDKNSNLRTERIMSHFGILEIPTYHKLVAVTDGALNIHPPFEHKLQILENAVTAMNKIGITNPRVAALAASEEVNEKLSESKDALRLKEINLEGKLKDCIVEGPISYDLAISKEAAEIKRYNSPVAGETDLLLVPNVTAGNLCSKALIYSGNTKSAGIILGAKVPIVVISRSSPIEDKYYSLMLGALAC